MTLDILLVYIAVHFSFYFKKANFGILFFEHKSNVQEISL